jgi:gliding motility-associated-like protein
MMAKKYLLLWIGMTLSHLLGAQDLCSNAVALGNVNNWCSAPAQFSNVGATPSNFVAGNCFSNDSHDVWFRFTATGQDVTITVVGAMGGTPNTLMGPEVALYYTANCSNFNELRCESPPFGQNIVSLYRGGLTPGETYYIRVDGYLNGTGTFQLCVNSYTAPSNPGSDCPDAAILCDKSPFVVQSVLGTGNNSNEAAGTCLDINGGFQNTENASTWFQWTCETSGSLTFVLSPINASDDLDFVLYELPNGLGNCNGKTALRCMASSCIGPTGLDVASIDVSEPPNCGFGQDNFVSAVNMVAGRSYALLINNFSNTGNGFSIEFGGTGTFLGPRADFEVVPSQICLGEAVTVADRSFFAVGQITDWEWNFGVDAQPANANARGPHAIVFSSPGPKSILLTVATNLGCIVSHIETVNVSAPVRFTAQQTDLPCFNSTTGAIVLTPQAGGGPYSYTWDNGAQSAQLEDLLPGTYTVTVSNQGCDSVVTYILTSPPPIELNATTRLATCNGGQDGAIWLDVSGGTPFFGGTYAYNWNQAGFGLADSLVNLPIGPYPVVVRDSAGCELADTLFVEELELVIDSFLSFIRPPSCYGYSDGRIGIQLGNGQAPYAFDWGPTGNFVTWDSLRTNLSSGTYAITVRDANFCFGALQIPLQAPDSLAVERVDSVDISCFGEADGQAVPWVAGGTYPYSFLWSDPMGQLDSVALGLAPGPVTVTVSDRNGCTATGGTRVVEPSLLRIAAVFPQDVSCFGDTTGQIALVATGGTPGYGYSADGIVFQSDSVLTGLPSAYYEVVVRDARGCEAEWEDIWIDQPFQLLVDAGEGLVIDLGDSVRLSAQVNSVWAERYLWTPDVNLSCDTCTSTWVRPFNTTFYTVLATDRSGCTAVDSVVVVVNPVRPLFVPNAFTPNADGLNEVFRPYNDRAVARVLRFSIYDRWGELVWQTANTPLEVGWDGTFHGKPMNTNVFVYYLEVEFLDGYIGRYQGDVQLIR